MRDSKIEQCWFCDEDRGKDGFTCGRLKCLTKWDDLTADEINHNERLIRTGVWKSLSQWCSPHPDHLSLVKRIFYTVKLWVCCLLGRRKCLSWREDPIQVVQIDFHTTYAGWDETWLQVGSGVFSGWFYELAHDSEWNM